MVTLRSHYVTFICALPTCYIVTGKVHGDYGPV